MPTYYHKLVRDRIPEIIHAQGRACATEVLTDAAYREALHAKLIEEAQELAQAPQDEILAEFADVREVLTALMAVYGISKDVVQAEQAARRDARGAFAQRLRLLWVD